MNFISSKLNIIKPSPTLAVVAKAKELKAQGKNVIDLGAGEPDFDTPQNIKNAAIKAINDGFTKYTAVDGIAELKNAIVEKLDKQNNLQYSTAQISVGCGAKQVIYNCLFASLEEGDEVIIPEPYWVSYPDMTLLCGGKPIIVETNKEFKLEAETLQKTITAKTKWLFLNSPSNPTGANYTKEELKELAEVLLKNNHVGIISDDIYEHLLYEGKFYNIATIEPKLKDRTVVINGVSKAYAMTGWRIGYAAADEKLIKAMSKVQSQSTSSPCSISQKAAVEALSGTQDFIAPNNEKFKKRRDMLVDGLNKIKGIKCQRPQGAFYVFPEIKDLIGKTSKEGIKINNDTDFCSALLKEELVAAVPGVAFGRENYFRISYATSDQNLKESLIRIEKFCKNLK